MKCKKINCNANSMKNNEFCYFHDDTTKSDRIEASRKGGMARELGSLLEPIEINQKEAIKNLLEDTINRVRRINSDGSMEVRTANCIGFLSSKIIEVIKNQPPIEQYQLDMELVEKEAIEYLQSVGWKVEKYAEK